MELLHKHNADLNLVRLEKQANGHVFAFTALLYAAQKNHLSVVQYFVSKGAG